MGEWMKRRVGGLWAKRLRDKSFTTLLRVAQCKNSTRLRGKRLKTIN
jgi:hypothetical protein